MMVVLRSNHLLIVVCRCNEQGHPSPGRYGNDCIGGHELPPHQREGTDGGMLGSRKHR